jgi:protocatechuate 3,4-dioxygenase beta subunit
MARFLNLLVILATVGTCQPVICQIITPDGQTLVPKTNPAASISGFISDAQTQEPILYATVILYQQAEAIQGCITNETGEYHFERITPGYYEIHIRYLGYKEKIMPLEVLTNQINKRLQADIRVEQESPCICIPPEIQPEVTDKSIQQHNGWLAEHIILQNTVF